MRKNNPKKPKICINCGKEFTPTSGVQKACKDCKKEVQRKKALERYYANGRKQYSNDSWEIIDGVRTYIKRGYNQAGENNNGYKGGHSDYNKKAFEHYPNICNRCGEDDINKLLVHHKNEDRNDASLENLEILCKRCHQNHHMERDSTGKFIGKKNHKG